jgi:hypothetical protein
MLLAAKKVGGDYAAQAEALKEVHEKAGKDLFVASFSLLQEKATGSVRSYCVWSEGVTSLLPRTDDVFFRPKGDEGGDIVPALWERVEAALGDLPKPAGLYPEWYVVEDFPSAEQLATLGPQWPPGREQGP